MCAAPKGHRLDHVSPELECLLTRGDLPPRQFAVSDIKCQKVWIAMRDGTRLAADLYLPPLNRAPVIAVRTPYDRSREDRSFVAALLAFARRGYVVVSQDCRGTGESEPDNWDYYVFEPEDSYDLIEWITRQQWYDGFIGSFGSSYVGQTQWCMAVHPAMSTIAPGVSGLGIAINTTHLHMFVNAYARSVGKGKDKAGVPYSELERLILDETLGSGYFNEPLHQPFSSGLLARFPECSELPPIEGKRRLWGHYCGMTCAQRAQFVKDAFGTTNVTMLEVEALSSVFGHWISHDRHTVPHVSPPDLCRLIQSPPLVRTAWYDWGLNDALATWGLLRSEASLTVAQRARMIITPYAHSMPGYKEGADAHPELLRVTNQLESVGLLMRWYAAIRDRATDAWPTVIYYLMGANEWRVASDWPIPEAKQTRLYLCHDGTLTREAPRKSSDPSRFIYDPNDPTPTLGGSILSYVYTPGSVDVSGVQKRADVLVFTSPPLERDLDVVGPLRMILYASSSAADTDFCARLSDVFPDGRAIQLQNGILRARYRNLLGEPELLEPDRIYRFEIDMWATANRFKAGHRLRLDISSADFPRFDRNSNRGGEPGPPISALQVIYHDVEHPSQLTFSVLNDSIYFT